MPILVCLACVALSLSLDILGEEMDRYRENLRMLNKLTDGDGLEKMRVLLGSEEFDRLISGKTKLTCSKSNNCFTSIEVSSRREIDFRGVLSVIRWT